MIIKLVVVVLGLMSLTMSIIPLPEEQQITITPTKEINIITGIVTRDGIQLELIEYETKEGYITSSFRPLLINKTIDVDVDIVGIKDGKYLLVIRKTIFNLSR